MELRIAKDVQVGMQYTLTVDGGVVDSTDGREPFQYIHGQGQLIPGLERQLEGMRVGESRELTVSPDDGYGPVDPSAFVEVSAEQFSPGGIPPALGTTVRGVSPEGQEFQARVHEMKKEAVVLDLNHPLAGKTLLFKVTVTDLVPATARSHVHQPE
jgi:FKBP-type peptidyl-prolyl cis-trans isomerase SlyD